MIILVVLLSALVLFPLMELITLLWSIVFSPSNGEPHFLQNLAVSEFSLLQFGHFILKHPIKCIDNTILVTKFNILIHKNDVEYKSKIKKECMIKLI